MTKLCQILPLNLIESVQNLPQGGCTAKKKFLSQYVTTTRYSCGCPNDFFHIEDRRLFTGDGDVCGEFRGFRMIASFQGFVHVCLVLDFRWPSALRTKCRDSRFHKTLFYVICSKQCRSRKMSSKRRVSVFTDTLGRPGSARNDAWPMVFLGLAVRWRSG